MENLNREAILRMLSGKTGNSSSGGGGGEIDLAGYATMIWVTENFVSIDFFRELFRAYDSNSQEILPNDTTSVVASIKAMVGTWTEEYLTALGNAGGGGGGGGGAQYLNDLLDVQLTTPLTDGQALVYNATLQKWVNGAAGVNMTTVWNALSGSTSEQINASHLSTALSGYVTTSAISDMATQTWVGQQGFATQTWVTSNFITIAYFDRLFRAYNDSTLVSHNDTTSTIDNIKAMFGFWTDFYLSALGTGGVSSVSISLSQLADVTLTSPTGGQALVYDATSNKWVNGTIQTGVSTLSSLTDVLLTSPTANQVLIWDATSSKWVNTSLKTINFQSIIGSGDISVGGGASGNYLPLTGGTVQSAINDASVSINNVYSGVTTVFRTSYGAGYGMFIGTSRTTGVYYIANFTSGITNTSGSNAISRMIIKANGNIGINYEDASYGLDINNETGFRKKVTLEDGCYFCGSPSFGFRFNDHNSNYNNFIISENGNTYTRGLVGINTRNPEYKLHALNDSSGWGACIYSSASTVLFSHTGSYGAYIGITSTSSSNYIADFRSGITINNGTPGYGSSRMVILANGNIGINEQQPSYRLHVDGAIYSTSSVTALSDIRHKTVIKDAAVSVEDIARMPAVMYQWNDGREDKGLHVGSIAQNWQTVLPEVVLKANDKEGTLSMQYGVAALVSSIIIARKVVNHEDRIKQLEKENKELKKRLNIA